MQPIKNNSPLESHFFTPQMKAFSEIAFKISAVASIAFMGLTGFALFTGATFVLPVTLGIISGITLISSWVYLKLISSYAENHYQFGKKSKEEKIALPHVLIAEKLGHAKAKFIVGLVLTRKTCDSSSKAEGIKKIEEAANLGYSKAQFYTAKLYEPKVLRTDGHDGKKAIEWLRKAAAQGYAPAQYKLGRLYQSGVASEAGFTRNLVKAKELYIKAASQDNADAKEALRCFDNDNERHDRFQY